MLKIYLDVVDVIVFVHSTLNLPSTGLIYTKKKKSFQDMDKETDLRWLVVLLMIVTMNREKFGRLREKFNQSFQDIRLLIVFGNCRKIKESYIVYFVKYFVLYFLNL